MEPSFVTAAGVSLAYTDTGSGPATVVVHGMGAEPSVAGLSGRVIAYDRRGYGESEAPEPYTRTTVSEQAEDLAAVVEHLGAAPATLVGHDLGALVVLDVVLRHPDVAGAAVLVDPPAYMFVASATEALSEERAALEDAVRSGGPVAGMEWWLASRGRTGRSTVRDAIAFFADYGAIATLPLTYGELRAVTAPMAIVMSEGARPHDLLAAEALHDALGDAHLAPSVEEAVELLGR